MSGVGLVGGALLLLVALLLGLALLVAPIVLLVWFFRAPGPSGPRRGVPFSDDDEIAARHHH